MTVTAVIEDLPSNTHLRQPKSGNRKPREKPTTAHFAAPDTRRPPDVPHAEIAVLLDSVAPRIHPEWPASGLCSPADTSAQVPVSLDCCAFPADTSGSFVSGGNGDKSRSSAGCVGVEGGDPIYRPAAFSMPSRLYPFAVSAPLRMEPDTIPNGLSRPPSCLSLIGFPDLP